MRTSFSTRSPYAANVEGDSTCGGVRGEGAGGRDEAGNTMLPAYSVAVAAAVITSGVGCHGWFRCSWPQSWGCRYRAAWGPLSPPPPLPSLPAHLDGAAAATGQVCCRHHARKHPLPQQRRRLHQVAAAQRHLAPREHSHPGARLLAGVCCQQPRRAAAIAHPQPKQLQKGRSGCVMRG